MNNISLSPPPILLLPVILHDISNQIVSLHTPIKDNNNRSSTDWVEFGCRLANRHGIFVLSFDLLVCLSLFCLQNGNSLQIRINPITRLLEITFAIDFVCKFAWKFVSQLNYRDHNVNPHPFNSVGECGEKGPFICSFLDFHALGNFLIASSTDRT